jgi:hypothetical protein
LNINNIEELAPIAVKKILLPFLKEWLSLIHKAHQV